MQFEIKDVCTSYPQSGIVLDHVNLQINKGEFIGIVGQGGSGKTTLLETFAGLHKPQSGVILFENEDIYNNNYNLISFRKKLQVVFQFPEYQFFENTVRDEISFGLKIRNFSTAEIENSIQHILDLLHISNQSEFLESSPFSLSGGQKRRLALACALVISPEVLLLDEPFAGLDAEGVNSLLNLLIYEKKKGTTVLLVCHDPNILCEIANRIIVLSHGKIISDGKPSDVYDKSNLKTNNGIGMPDTKIIADMIGLELQEDLSYNSFIEKLRTKYTKGEL